MQIRHSAFVLSASRFPSYKNLLGNKYNFLRAAEFMLHELNKVAINFWVFPVGVSWCHTKRCAESDYVQKLWTTKWRSQISKLEVSFMQLNNIFNTFFVIQCVSKKTLPLKFKLSASYCINLTALTAWN